MEQEILNMMHDVESLTLDIGALLASIRKYDEAKLKNVNTLYSKRKTAIDNLLEQVGLLRSGAGENIPVEYRKKFDNFEYDAWVRKVTEQDKYNLEMLEQKMQQTKEELKKALKRKSLLLYMKDK